MQVDRKNHSEHDHIREFTFPDGKRRIAFHRKHVAFICELEKAGHVLIAARADAKPCPVLGEYADVLTWWKGEAKGKAALSQNSQGQNAPEKSAAYAKPGDVKESCAGIPASGRTGRPILTLPKQIERKASTASGLSNAVDRAEGGVSRRSNVVDSARSAASKASGLSIPEKGKSATKALR